MTANDRSKENLEWLKSKEEVRQMCNNHADWFCKTIKPLFSTSMEHGYKHGHEDGYIDGVHETKREIAEKESQNMMAKPDDLEAEFKSIRGDE